MLQKDEEQPTDTAEHKFPSAEQTQLDPPMTPAQKMGEATMKCVQQLCQRN